MNHINSYAKSLWKMMRDVLDIDLLMPQYAC